jgi:hypothetical protein
MNWARSEGIPLTNLQPTLRPEVRLLTKMF